MMLPYELWFYIAWFIPPETLAQICDLHPAFYEAFVQPYQGRLELIKRDKWTKKVMKCLNTFSGFNHYFKSVAIQPWLIEAQLKPARRRRDKLRTAVCQMLDHGYIVKQSQLRLQKRLKKDVYRLTNALQSMRNVEEYEIFWDGSPKYHPEFYRAFCIPIFQCWAPTLKRVSLTIPPTFLKYLPLTHLPVLTSLAYYFPTDSRSWQEIVYDHEGFLVFVHNLKDTLQDLTLVSTCKTEHLKLDQFLDELGYFPKLRSFSFSIPRDGNHLPDPTSLCRFLERHSTTITSITLATSESALRDSTDGPGAVSPVWMTKILEGLCYLPQLQSLKLGLTPEDNPPLTQVASVLQKHSATLVSLALDYHPISLSEFDVLFRPSSFGPIIFPELTRITLYLNSFTPELFCSIAEQMPALRHLDIVCSSSSEMNMDVWTARISNAIESGQMSMSAFRSWSMGTRMSVTPSCHGLGQVLDTVFRTLRLGIHITTYKEWPAIQRLMSR